MPDHHPTFQYKWPSKVLRYKISCPSQRLLIAKHESQIDWSGHRIESGEALDHYLREVMLPGLKDCITPDHPKSHYCKSIHLDRMLANPAPHINEARQIRQREGDEAARQFLLEHINRHKKEHFEGWWRYLMEENPLYAQRPAFQYLVLRPVLEGSTAKDTRTPLPVDVEALAHLFDRMNKGRVAPGSKLLSVLSEIMAFGAKAAGDGKRPSFGTDCRWVVVKQQDSNAANRVAALSQGSGWCVASSSMAAFYLRSSDFHMLLERGRTKVALRLSWNQAVEVQGYGNGDPGPWWPRILLYCAARGTQITHRHDAAHSRAQSIRQELVAAQRTTRQFGELLTAQPAKVHLVTMPEELDEASRLVVQEAWLACVRTDPLCGGLLPGWMEADPAVKQATLEAWIALVRSDPQSYAAVPGALAQEPRILAALRVGWMELLRRDVTRWNQCPEFLQLEFRQDGGFIQTFKMGWMNLLKRDATQWYACPDFLRQEEVLIQALKIGWMNLLKRDVTKWTTCPEFLQQDEEVTQAHKAVWMELLERDVTKWSTCPEFLQQEFRQDGGFIPAFKTGWMKLIKRHDARWNECPEFLQQEFRSDDRFILAFKSRWLKLLKLDLRRWDKCPEFLWRDFIGDQGFVLNFRTGWMKLLEWDVASCNACPEHLRQDKDVIQAYKNSWIEMLKRDATQWKCCPEFLQKDEEVTQAHKNSWIEMLKRDATRWNVCPDFLQQDIDVIQSRKIGWMKLIKRDDAKWNECPEFLQQEFRQDDEFIETYRATWMEMLKRDVQRWDLCPEFLQQEFRQNDEFIQEYRARWVELLKRNVSSWSRPPDFLQLDDEVIQACKEGWIKKLKGSDARWYRCPDAFKEDRDLIDAWHLGWINLIKNDITQWPQCPQALRHHADIKQARIEGEIQWTRSVSPDQRSRWVKRLVHQKIVPIADLPEDLRILIQDALSSSQQALPSNPLPAYAAASFKVLLQEPRATLPIVQGWKHSPRLELARCAQALALLRQRPWNFIALPADQQSHPLIHEAAVEGWVVFVTKHHHFLDQVPESLRTHPKLQTTLSSLREAEKKAQAKKVLEEVKKRPGLSDEVMSELHLPAKDKQMWKQVTALRLRYWKKQVKSDARAWEKVPQSLQHDEDILKLMREGIGPQIRQHPTLWNQLSACYRNDPCLQRVHRFATRS